MIISLPHIVRQPCSLQRPQTTSSLNQVYDLVFGFYLASSGRTKPHLCSRTRYRIQGRNLESDTARQLSNHSSTLNVRFMPRIGRFWPLCCGAGPSWSRTGSGRSTATRSRGVSSSTDRLMRRESGICLRWECAGRLMKRRNRAHI